MKCIVAPNLALYSLQSDKRNYALSEGGHVFTNPDIMISRMSALVLLEVTYLSWLMRLGAEVHMGRWKSQVYGTEGESRPGQRKYAVEPTG
jgi:hypothetical protein